MRPAIILFAATLIMAVADVGAQHAFLEPCDRTHAWQPTACYMNNP